MLGFFGTRTLRPSSTPARRRAERGVTAVEFALLAPAFFLLLIGVTEVSLFLLAQHLLENATYNASRLGKTGFIAEGKTQQETVMDALVIRLQGLSPLIDVAKVTMTATSYGDLSMINQPDQAVEGLGTPQQVVVYTVTYPWTFFTPLIGQLMGDENNQVQLSSRIVVRNEPYD